MRLGSIAAAVGTLLATAAPAQAAEQVLYVGDSLGVGTTPAVARELGSEARVHGDSRIGRPSGEGLTVLRQSFTPADQVVIFDLGTNDDPAQPERLAADLSAARRLTGDRCIVVATLNRPPLNGVSVDGLNRALLAFADRAPAVQLVDWHAIVASEPSLLGPDRIHPTPQGYTVRAQLFAEAVASCSATPAAEPPPVATTNPPKRVGLPRKPPRQFKVPGIESSGISFTEPVKVRDLHGELLLPNTKPPYPAVVMLNGAASAAEFLAAHGIAALTFPFRNSEADAKAAAALLGARDDVPANGVGLWGFAAGSDIAARAAAGNRGVGAVVAVAPSPLARGSQRDWAVRRELGGAGARPVSTWLRMRARGDASLRSDSAQAWRRVAQPVLAIWGTRDRYLPIRDSAAALKAALESGSNADRTFRWFDAGHAGAVIHRDGAPVFAPGFLEETARWMGTRLGSAKAKARVSTPLPPSNEGPNPVDVTKASFASAPATQAMWLLLPALLWAVAALRMRHAFTRPRRLFATAVFVDVAALAAILAGIAVVLAPDGRDVPRVAGTPWLFALAFAFTAGGVVLTILLARYRIWPAVMGSALWLALALYWLL